MRSGSSTISPVPTISTPTSWSYDAPSSTRHVMRGFRRRFATFWLFAFVSSAGAPSRNPYHIATRWMLPSGPNVAQFMVCTPCRKSSISRGVILIWSRWLTPCPKAFSVVSVCSSAMARNLLGRLWAEGGCHLREESVGVGTLRGGDPGVVVAREGLEDARTNLRDDRRRDGIGFHAARRGERWIVAIPRERELRAARTRHEQLRVDSGAEQIEVQRFGVELERTLRRRVRADARG